MPTQTATNFTIAVTHEMVPSFKLLVFFAREDGELIADLMEVKVKCELKEKVRELIICWCSLYCCATGEHSFW